MHHVSRSQRYREEIDQFLKSGKDFIHLKLYGNEITRCYKHYPDLSFEELVETKEFDGDKKILVLVRKINTT